MRLRACATPARLYSFVDGSGIFSNGIAFLRVESSLEFLDPPVSFIGWNFLLLEAVFERVIPVLQLVYEALSLFSAKTPLYATPFPFDAVGRSFFPFWL